MIEAKKVAPITKGVKFIPGRRYMVNTETGVTFPYQAQMINNPNMREIFPKFEEASVVENVVPEPESIETEEPIEIEDIIVALPAEPVIAPEPETEPEPAPLKPWQKAQAAKKSKAAIIEG